VNPRKVVVRAPTRIDFGGGWTDVPPYCSNEGGFVCNAAINRYAVATVTASPDPGQSRPSRSTSSDPLVAAALRHAGVLDVQVSLVNDFPVGSGSGGSSAGSAAVLGALAVWHGLSWDRRKIAEEGRRIEVEELGIAGGRQDHYAATHGGALALRFAADVTVTRLPLSTRTAETLERRALLVHTNESRISGHNIVEVLNSYRDGAPRVLEALRRMKALAERMSLALAAGDIDELGRLVGEHWWHQRALHPAIPTPRIDAIIERATKCGAIGAKAMGASGGGCVLVIASDESVERVRDALGPLGTPLSFRLDFDGLCRSD